MSDFENQNTASDYTWQGQAEALARREPTKAVATAFGAGLLLSLLPARAIMRALATLGLALLRPALCGFGIRKLWELCPSKRKL